MKYVVIIAIIVLFVRIDYWLELFDRATEGTDPPQVEVLSSDLDTNREIISYSKDPNFKQVPRTSFLTLLEDFRGGPEASIREKAMSILNKNPTMFGQKVDSDLESYIFRWRDLLILNNAETVQFLLDLMNTLEGENLLMVKKFFSLWMEINMEHFIAAYSRSKDVNCMTAALFGDNLPAHEKINEYYVREAALKKFLLKEKVEPAQRALANNCLMVIGLQISKITPTPEAVAPVGVTP